MEGVSSIQSSDNAGQDADALLNEIITKLSHKFLYQVIDIPIEKIRESMQERPEDDVKRDLIKTQLSALSLRYTLRTYDIVHWYDNLDDEHKSLYNIFEKERDFLMSEYNKSVTEISPSLQAATDEAAAEVFNDPDNLSKNSHIFNWVILSKSLLDKLDMEKRTFLSGTDTETEYFFMFATDQSSVESIVDELSDAELEHTLCVPLFNREY